MRNQLLFSLTLALLFHFYFNTTLAQSPAASPVAPPVPTAAPPVPTAAPPTVPLVPITAVSPAGSPTAPPNIIKILEKGGHFTLFVRLLKSTNVGDQINSQLSKSENGLTVFAPSDYAFSSLKPGTVNSLNDEQQAELVQSHFVPTFIPTTLFQTVSNPLRTLAGDTRPGQFPLNVTISGNNVNVATGVMNTDISGTIYTDSQIAMYQVDKVLLPWKIFGTPVPTAVPTTAPAPLTPTKKKTPPATIIPTTTSDDDASGGVSLTMHEMVVTIGVVVVASFLL